MRTLSGPVIRFMGVNLSNHSYVNLFEVGNASDGRDSVQCHTDYIYCCYHNRVGWFSGIGVITSSNLPHFERVSSRPSRSTMHQQYRDRRIDLRQSYPVTFGFPDKSGIYRCDIETYPENYSLGGYASVTVSIYVGLFYLFQGECVCVCVCVHMCVHDLVLIGFAYIQVIIKHGYMRGTSIGGLKEHKTFEEGGFKLIQEDSNHAVVASYSVSYKKRLG